jgi:hypothetical protein
MAISELSLEPLMKNLVTIMFQLRTKVLNRAMGFSSNGTNVTAPPTPSLL